MVTAAVGGFLTPVVMELQIASKGGASSCGIVKSGESQRTMDEGSSNRMIRLSNLPLSRVRSTSPSR